MDEFASSQGRRSQALLSKPENGQPPVTLFNTQRVKHAGAWTWQQGDELMDAPIRDSVGAEHNIEFCGD
jgi:hypothetical protein